LPAIAKLTTGFPSEIILVRPVGGDLVYPWWHEKRETETSQATRF